MGKVGIFQLAKWGFMVRDEINAAFADDKKISAKEMLKIYKNLSEEIKLPVDEKTQETIDFVGEMVDELEIIAADNKVSIQEILTLVQKLCDQFGYDLDDAGFNIPELPAKTTEDVDKV